MALEIPEITLGVYWKQQFAERQGEGKQNGCRWVSETGLQRSHTVRKHTTQHRKVNKLSSRTWTSMSASLATQDIVSK
jgi:hypothetical protein